MSAVRTVLGDLAPGALGRVNYHEHLFQVTPLLPSDELNDEARSSCVQRLDKNVGITSCRER